MLLLSITEGRIGSEHKIKRRSTKKKEGPSLFLHLGLLWLRGEGLISFVFRSIVLLVDSKLGVAFLFVRFPGTLGGQVTVNARKTRGPFEHHHISTKNTTLSKVSNLPYEGKSNPIEKGLK